MKTKVKVALITASATIIASIAGSVVGKAIEYKNNQNEIITAFGNTDITIGDNNIITYNNIVDNIQKLQTENASLSEQSTKYVKDLKNANDEYTKLKQESDKKIHELEQQLNEQIIVNLNNPELKILGENINTTLVDYVASINGHTYYLEDFLNQILPEKISYQSNCVQYGENLPERVNVVKEKNMLANNNGFLVYNQDNSFYMGGVKYDSGLVLSETWQDCSIYINTNKKYSKLTFTLGHVDNSNTAHRMLKISYLNADGEYIPTEFDCYGGMPKQEVSIDIFNTETVKIYVPQGSYQQFGLADMYLVK